MSGSLKIAQFYSNELGATEDLNATAAQSLANMVALHSLRHPFGASTLQVLSGLKVQAQGAPGSTVRLLAGVAVDKTNLSVIEIDADQTINILSGAENKAGGVWGTGQAADAVNPRKTVIGIKAALQDTESASRSFKDTSTTPATLYNSNVNTRKINHHDIVVVHGVPVGVPAEPALPGGYTKLAVITVAANANTVTTGAIAGSRPNVRSVAPGMSVQLQGDGSGTDVTFEIKSRAGTTLLSVTDAGAMPELDARFILAAEMGIPGGVATLDGAGHVPSGQLPNLSGAYISTTLLAANNGVATLNSSGRLVQTDTAGAFTVHGGLGADYVTFVAQGVAPPGAKGLLYFDDATKSLKVHDGTSYKDVGVAALIKRQEFTATEAQTVFNITVGSYKLGTNTLQVFADTFKLSGSSYDETSTTSFTLSEGLPAGTLVEAYVIEAVPFIGAAHATSHIPGGGDDLSIYYTLKSREGVASGVAQLNADGIALDTQLPDSMLIESVLAVPSEEPTSIVTAFGPCTEFADAAKQSVIFARKWPDYRGGTVDLMVAMDTANAGNVRMQVSYQVNGGAATNVPVTITPGNTTTIVPINLGTIFAAGTVAVNSLVTFTLSRLGADAADTHTGKLRVYSTRLRRV